MAPVLSPSLLGEGDRGLRGRILLWQGGGPEGFVAGKRGFSPAFCCRFPKHRRNHVLMWALPGCLCHSRGDSFLPGKIKKGFFVILVSAAAGGDEMLPAAPQGLWGDGGCRAPAGSLFSWSCRDAWHAAVPGLWIPSVPSRLHGSAQAGDG